VTPDEVADLILAICSEWDDGSGDMGAMPEWLANRVAILSEVLPAVETEDGDDELG
jgi:hypothetical protein